MLDFLLRLAQSGIKFRRHKSKRAEITICCPFCQDRGRVKDVEFKLGLNIVTNQAHCFRCDWASKHGMESVLRSFGKEGFAKYGVEEVPEKLQIPRLPVDCMQLRSNSSFDLCRMAYQYLRQRNIPDWQIEQKQLKVSMTGHFAHRIIVPFYREGNLVGYTGRSFTGGEPKYLHTVNLKEPYNVPDAPKSTVILCEGVFDAFSIERAVNGRCDVVSLMGHSMSEYKYSILKQYKKFVLYPDPNFVGIKGMTDVGIGLVNAFKTVWIAEPGKLDAGATDEKELKERLEASVRFTHGKVQIMRLRYAV